MAPELSRSAAYLGHAVDVWAFGCVLYEALHGYAPFRGETMEQLQLRIKKVSHEPLHRDLSTEARSLLESCLTHDAAARATAEGAQAHPWLNEGR
jgi:cell division cycle 2-like protein|tara:strand:- start:10 stop:294 length:285 start_codon:yes stop_codon:yes gene_type:complete